MGERSGLKHFKTKITHKQVGERRPLLYFNTKISDNAKKANKKAKAQP
jgi:hypothetical protein